MTMWFDVVVARTQAQWTVPYTKQSNILVYIAFIFNVIVMFQNIYIINAS